MLAGREPFATWYYPFAWYGTLLLLEGALALRRGRFLLLDRPAHLVSLLAWSAAAWLFFELLNLRLQNWYYVFVPGHPVARWAGILLSFATVFPAIFLVEALLESFGTAEGVRTRPFRAAPAARRRLAVAGAGLLALPLLWPRPFFPLVWVGPLLLAESFTHARDPSRSLLGDLERGRPGRALRLLASGAVVGLLWEIFNARARGKWIYTVPGLEDLKLFEMPVAGFLGFPPFALECFALWQALVLAGVAFPGRAAGRGRAPPERTEVRRAAVRRNAVLRRGAGARRGAVVGAALAVAAAAAWGMEARTITSRTPRLAELPGVPAAELARAGHDVFSVARASPADLAALTGRSPREADDWVRAARLAALRGIGTANARALRAVGIASVEELARAAPASLAARLAGLARPPVSPARARVWVRAAAREADAGRARESAARPPPRGAAGRSTVSFPHRDP
jgi:predicted flap endonuclease-1-like 5' DNA nuclease